MIYVDSFQDWVHNYSALLT